MKCASCNADGKMLHSVVVGDGVRKRRYVCRSCEWRWTAYSKGDAAAVIPNGCHRIGRALALVKAGLL